METLTLVAREIGQSHIGELLLAGLRGAVLGGLAGVALAGLALLVVRLLGLYRSDWAHAAWVRIPACAILAIAFPVGIGVYGLLGGAYEGAQAVVSKSQLATQVFPKVGDAAADMLYFVQSSLTGVSGTAEWERGELDVEDLFERLERLEKEVVIDNLRADLKSKVLARSPELAGGVKEQLLDGVLWVVCDKVLKRVVRQKLAQALADHGLDVEFGRSLAEIRAAARAGGDPRTISRAELSACLVREVVVPAVVAPIRHIVKSQQRMALLLLALAVLGPWLAFRVFDRLRPRAPAA